MSRLFTLFAAIYAVMCIVLTNASPIGEKRVSPNPTPAQKSPASLPMATVVKRVDDVSSISETMPDVSEVKTGKDAKTTSKPDDKNTSKDEDEDKDKKTSKSDDDDKKKTTESDSKKKDDKKSTDTESDKDKDDKKKTKSDDDDDDDDKDDKKKSKTTSISVDPRMPAGTISMVKPASTDTTYLKIGEKATFKWEYKSLSVTPKKLNVLATATSYSGTTITIATDHPAKSKEIVWDTAKTDKDSDVELLTAKYNLLIFDAEGNMSMIAQAGYLSPLSFAIGVYRPQSYTPMPDESSYTNDASLPDLTLVKWMVGLSVVVLASGLQVILS